MPGRGCCESVIVDVMTTILRAETAADFLAIVPNLAGYRARESLVCVAFRGRRTSGAFRLDLPRRDDRTHADALVHAAISMMSRMPGADSLVPIIYTDERFVHERTTPRRELGLLLADRFHDAGFRLRDALCVAADGWASYFEPDPPKLGHPLERIEQSPLAAQAAESCAGEPEPGDVAACATPVHVDPGLRRAVRAALRTARPPEGEDAIAAVEHLAQLEPDAASAEDLASLIAMVQAAPCRDQAMLQFAFGAEVGRAVAADHAALAEGASGPGASFEALARDGVADAAVADSIDGRLTALALGLTTERPDVDRVHCAIALLRVAAEAAPYPLRPNPLCMLSWLAWSLGLSSAAAVFADRALEIDERHGMSSLLMTMFGAGLVPEWAFHDPAAISDPPAAP
jgi:hypothetical protein